jgi:hypothetical protein
MKVTDLDMAAAIIAATGQHPVLNNDLECGPTGFWFDDNEATTGAVSAYVTGELFLPAKKLLKARGDLYKQLRRKK